MASSGRFGKRFLLRHVVDDHGDDPAEDGDKPLCEYEEILEDDDAKHRFSISHVHSFCSDDLSAPKSGEGHEHAREGCEERGDEQYPVRCSCCLFSTVEEPENEIGDKVDRGRYEKDRFIQKGEDREENDEARRDDQYDIGGFLQVAFSLCGGGSRIVVLGGAFPLSDERGF